MQQLFGINYLILSVALARCGVSISFLNQNYNGIQAGIPFTLTWEGAQGPVALGLLFRTNPFSPQNTTMIATGITASQFNWTPPDWASGVFEQKIEAQDTIDLTLTNNFTIARAAAATTSMQQNAGVVTNTAQITTSNTTATNPAVAAHSESSSAARARVGVGICIVVILIIIGVALIFFEHGKRVVARQEQQRQRPGRLDLGRAERGTMGIELANIGLSQKEIEKAIMEEPSTPLMYSKHLPFAIELDGGVMGGAQKGTLSAIEKKRRQQIKSMRSIYELG